MREKTPQEKKALSYAKDCRNTYGENDKCSRKSIPLRKAKVNRSYRKNANQVLQQINGDIDLDKAEVLESEARSVKRENWKKVADAPLGEVVERKLENREVHAGKGKTLIKKTREFIENLKIEIERETDSRWIAEATELNGVLVYGKTEKEAIENCKRLARLVFLENSGAIKILRINDDSTSVLEY